MPRTVPTLAWTLLLALAYPLTALVVDSPTALVLVVNPLVTLVVALVAGLAHRAWWLPLGAAAAWLPTVALLNDSALVYAPAYALVAALGLGLAALVLRRRAQSKAPRSTE